MAGKILAGLSRNFVLLVHKIQKKLIFLKQKEGYPETEWNITPKEVVRTFGVTERTFDRQISFSTRIFSPLTSIKKGIVYKVRLTLLAGLTRDKQGLVVVRTNCATMNQFSANHILFVSSNSDCLSVKNSTGGG